MSVAKYLPFFCKNTRKETGSYFPSPSLRSSPLVDASLLAGAPQREPGREGGQALGRAAFCALVAAVRWRPLRHLAVEPPTGAWLMMPAARGGRIAAGWSGGGRDTLAIWPPALARLSPRCMRGRTRAAAGDSSFGPGCYNRYSLAARKAGDGKDALMLLVGQNVVVRSLSDTQISDVRHRKNTTHVKHEIRPARPSAFARAHSLLSETSLQVVVRITPGATPASSEKRQSSDH